MSGFSVLDMLYARSANSGFRGQGLMCSSNFGSVPSGRNRDLKMHQLMMIHQGTTLYMITHLVTLHIVCASCNTSRLFRIVATV